MLKVFLSFILFFQICVLGAGAITPSEYCDVHNQSGAPGTCTVCGEEWVVVKDNIGVDTCKKCGDGGCVKKECSQCTDYPACTKK